MIDPFVKTSPGMPPEFFESEAASLRWLAEARAVRVVEILAVTRDRLTLARLTSSTPTHDDAERFGRDLAALHDAGANGWGAGPPGVDRAWLGTLEQRNQSEETWGKFYAQHRVLPHARRAHESGGIDDAGLATLERLGERLAEGVFDDDTAPARLHGDLWSGNVVTTGGGWTLIDPAAHGGDRLTDLAMLDLFGNPFLDRTLRAYAECAELPHGWRDLIELHQVHPLVVHAALFGGGYGARAVAAAARYC